MLYSLSMCYTSRAVDARANGNKKRAKSYYGTAKLCVIVSVIFGLLAWIHIMLRFMYPPPPYSTYSPYSQQTNSQMNQPPMHIHHGPGHYP